MGKAQTSAFPHHSRSPGRGARRACGKGCPVDPSHSCTDSLLAAPSTTHAGGQLASVSPSISHMAQRKMRGPEAPATEPRPAPTEAQRAPRAPPPWAWAALCRGIRVREPGRKADCAPCGPSTCVCGHVCPACALCAPHSWGREMLPATGKPGQQHCVLGPRSSSAQRHRRGH